MQPRHTTLVWIKPANVDKLRISLAKRL